MKRNYIDNKKFFTEISEYLAELQSAKERGEYPLPRVTEYLGNCLILIATELANKGNFVNYTFKEDMISDAIDNCLTYIDRFDPTKSKNPFAYFSQISYYAFVRRILKEKKQYATKYRYIESLDLDSIVRQIHDEGSSGHNLVTYLKKQAEIAKRETSTADVPDSVKRRPKYFAAAPTEPSLDITD